jgi:predicted Rossmann fold nucleotide-binding protein DprA/Smf involved in DNA uptake
MIKMAIVGSRYMSGYGKRVIGELMGFLKDKAEVVTIRVMGCNSEIIRLGAKKIFSGKNFEELNDEISDYADMLVVIEGREKSGTLLLASKFVEKNKDIYCIPGRITDEESFATNWLIKQGAIPLIRMDDLTEVLQ